MAQTLNPIASLLDRGLGDPDLIGSFIAAAEVDLNFLNTNDLVLFVNNGGAGTLDVTLQSQPDPFGRSVDVIYSAAELGAVPIGGLLFIPFMNREMFNLGTTVSVILGQITSVTVGLYRLTKQ